MRRNWAELKFESGLSNEKRPFLLYTEVWGTSNKLRRAYEERQMKKGHFLGMYIAGRREVTELQIEKVLGRIADEKNLKKPFSWQTER